MNWFLIVRIAILSLMRNKIRSFLAMLGIIIGVSAVITVVALGEGTQAKIQSRIASLGTNMITIIPGSTSSNGVRSGAFGSTHLTIEDALFIKKLPNITNVSPLTNNSAQLIYQRKNWSTSVAGCSGDYQFIRDWTLAEGRFITEEDVRRCSKICVLGDTVAKELFPTGGSLGANIRINKTPVKVIGILVAKGDGNFGPGQDDMVLVPYTTAMSRLFCLRNIRSIECSASSESTFDDCVEDITELLRSRHHLYSKDENDFYVHTQVESVNVVSETNRTFSFFLTGVASVSLVVGGIGIMNIMLVSITERIREIGIRMALGAKSSDIMLQFLTESLMLSSMGGIIGILFAFGLTNLASRFTSMSMQISTHSIILAFAFSVSVGVFFGLYPAVQASKLDPIQALRHE